MTKDAQVIEKIESSVKVYFSSDYGAFKFLKGNRDINENKVEKILKAIQEEDIDILKYCPILVDEQFRILDGQHRFYVSKKLGRPVFYIQISNMDIRGVAKINSNSSNWKIKDYLNTYCDLQRSAYLQITELIESGFKMNPLYLGALIHSGKVNAKGIKEIFIDGSLESNHFDRAKMLCSHLKDFTPYTKQPYSRRFAEAIERLLKSELYNHDEMIRQLKRSNLQIDRLDSAKAIITNMEEVYNFRMRERKRII